MISQKVKQFANKHGYDFFVNGLGYRTMAQITNLDGTVNISRCSNNSKLALQAINALIAQRKLDAKSDDAIADEAIEIIADLLPPVANEEIYQELQPVVVDPWEQRRAERIAAQGALTADDFRSTYERADNFGDDAFVFSARYGEMALI
jgi:hypothetical protein